MPGRPVLGRLAALLRDAMAIGAALSLVFSSAATLLWLAFAGAQRLVAALVPPADLQPGRWSRWC